MFLFCQRPGYKNDSWKGGLKLKAPRSTFSHGSSDEQSATYSKDSKPFSFTSSKRKHMHIVENGQTLLVQASIPTKLWDEASQASVFIANRFPTLMLQNKTPLGHSMNHKDINA